MSISFTLMETVICDRSAICTGEVAALAVAPSALPGSMFTATTLPAMEAVTVRLAARATASS